MNEFELFLAALDKAPAERASFLAGACAGDAALRHRVEALLRSHEGATDFLDTPAVEQIAAVREGAGADLSFLAPPSEPGSLGRLDHYEVLEVVGTGGTGVVLRARDAKLRRVVGLKVLAAPLAVSGTARKRFAREARAAAAVRDEHVVAIHAVRDDGPVPYLVMEFVEGTSLDGLVRRSGPLEVKEVLRIGVQVARGLAAAHAQGLVHRDVKPANILLENGVQRVKLTDFGLARAADDASLTQSGLIAGTPLYMAPEQANGEPLDHRADLFSLGSVLYELCTGRPAFRAPTTAAVLRRVSDAAPRPIREVNADIPEALCAVIGRLHARNPADRFSTAREVADLLEGLLAGLNEKGWRLALPAAATRPSAPRRVRFSRRWLPAAAAALALVAAGLGMGEATGVTDMRGTVIRLFSPEGTLVVEVDDPTVSVALDGADVVITGAGVKEIRLKPGQYRLETSKDGKVFRRELVAVARNGRQVVRVSKEGGAVNAGEAWEKSVAALTAEEQVKAVAQRLKELNPGFDGTVYPRFEYGAVTHLQFVTDAVEDVSPLRALTRLASLSCCGTAARGGKLVDLSPLRGLPLTWLGVGDNPVSDLEPLKGMPLRDLWVYRTRVADLSPLRGLPFRSLHVGDTNVTDLAPLEGMTLTELTCDGTGVSDLAPLKGMPLKHLGISNTRVADLTTLKGMPLEQLSLIETPVTDLTPIKDLPLARLLLTYRPERDMEILRSLKTLQSINGKAAAEFWKEVGGP